MKGKELIKWIQDNNAEDLEVFIEHFTPTSELFSKLHPAIIDHSNNEDIVLKYNTKEKYACYVGKGECNGYTSPMGKNDVYLEKFVSL